MSVDVTVQEELWPEEEWRAVPGYEGLYEVSSHERIWSVPRKGIGGQNIRGRMLKPSVEPFGYKRVVLYKDGAPRGFRLHELVAMAFLGPRPAGARLIRHLDGDPGNSFASNLAYGDFEENSADARTHRRLYGGARHPNAPQPTVIDLTLDVADLPGEVWADVVGYEGLYRVSSLGRILSLPRINAAGRRWPGRILKQNLGDHGRPEVNLTKNGKQKVRRVHQLVAEAFLGPCPEGMVVCHWDDVKTNNAVTNLRYATMADNGKDRLRNSGHHFWGVTHCPYNHEYTPENTVYNSKGGRACRECARTRGREAARAKVRARGPRKRACDHCGEIFEIPLGFCGPRRYCTDDCVKAAAKLRKQAREDNAA